MRCVLAACSVVAINAFRGKSNAGQLNLASDKINSERFFFNFLLCPREKSVNLTKREKPPINGLNVETD